MWARGCSGFILRSFLVSFESTRDISLSLAGDIGRQCKKFNSSEDHRRDDRYAKGVWGEWRGSSSFRDQRAHGVFILAPGATMSLAVSVLL